jgi:ABC-type branched-subunit amino acid transport system ATPase component
VDGLTVRFGGLTAVDNVTLQAPAGIITGLIGPNGAGKTTIFNACCGLVEASGRIRLGGRDLSGLSPSARAQAGLGRTFQRIELCDRLTVAENVALGPIGLSTRRHPWGQLWATRAQRAEIDARVEAALVRCGILHLGRASAGELSTGQRRFVELARAVASPFLFLLLDEPSSGLDLAETERFGRVLAALAGERGTGVLLVEHDMALVRAICRDTWVLDFGQLIASGPTAVVLASDVVRAAYLGSEEVVSEEVGSVA